MWRPPRLSLGLGLLALSACSAGERAFVALPSLPPETSGLLVTEGPGGAQAFESFEPEGASPRLEVEAGTGKRVYCAVLDGPLSRLGLPAGRWDENSGPHRALGEIEILEALVLDEGGTPPGLRADPSARGVLEKLQVPDLRSCLQLEISPGAVSDQSVRIFDVVDLGADRLLSLNGDVVLELHAQSGRTVVRLEGTTALYPRALVFDPREKTLWIRSLFGTQLLRAPVPDGVFDVLRTESVVIAGDERAESIDAAVPEPGGASLLAIATVGGRGERRVRLRGEGREERVFDLSAEVPDGLEVRVGGPDEVFLFSEGELWHLTVGASPARVSLPAGTSALSLRWSPIMGALAGLSDGSVRRVRDQDLETIVELGGWWVLEVAPFERGFAYLLANGVIGQFIEGEGRCAETPVLGTLNDGRLVPAEERWFVSGVLPEGGARLAILPRLELP